MSPLQVNPAIRLAAGAVLLIVSMGMAALSLTGRFTSVPTLVFEVDLLLVSIAHLVWAAVMMYGKRSDRLFRLQEMLLALALCMFLFSYIYARNANLDYVQRFILTGGNLNLSPDTRAERLLTWVRFFPFIFIDLVIYLMVRMGNKITLHDWALPATLVSALLMALALPSFASLDGIGLLGLCALVPLYLILRRQSIGWGVAYGTIYGVFFTLLTHYWLATFNLVSLQFTVVLYSLFYALFFAVLLVLWRLLEHNTFGSASVMRIVRLCVTVCCWVAFEYLRSSGFMGFPWGLAAHTQYAYPAFIQLSALTGVWGVSFVVVGCNVILADAIDLLRQRRIRAGLIAIGCAIGLPLLVVVGGAIALTTATNDSPDRFRHIMRVAAIQQNSDPRKHDYGETLDRLIRLTDRAFADHAATERPPTEQIDLVLWPETAFVPNIRRWSTVDPDSNRYGRPDRPPA